MENHTITIENKKRLEITEVISLEAFDDDTILANIEGAGIIISGEHLTVETLDIESGVLVAEGLINSVSYVKRREQRKIILPFRK